MTTTATRSKTAEQRAALGTRLAIEVPCEACNCEGHYHDPSWIEFGQQLEKAEIQAETELGVGRYEKRSEVMTLADAILREKGILEPSGPEQPACGECEGKGRITKDVTIHDLARMIDQANGLCGACRLPSGGIHVCTGRGGRS